MIELYLGERTTGYLFASGGALSDAIDKPMSDQRFGELLQERMIAWTTKSLGLKEGKGPGVNLYRHARITDMRAGDKTYM